MSEINETVWLCNGFMAKEKTWLEHGWTPYHLKLHCVKGTLRTPKPTHHTINSNDLKTILEWFEVVKNNVSYDVTLEDYMVNTRLQNLRGCTND